MMRKRPTGWVARCQCGELIGALDRDRSEQPEISRCISGWLAAGCAIEPRFGSNWSVDLVKCGCKGRG